jgi:pimeloyl-ACP methyl ester carboxylesterase
VEQEIAAYNWIMEEKTMKTVLATGLVASMLLGGTPADAQRNKHAPVTLQDMGIMYVGGERVESPNSGCLPTFCGPNNTGVAVQSTDGFFGFVEYFIPQAGNGAKKPPIVLIPGRNIMGNTYQMKPPGGESWTSFFLRQGYPVYLFTQPGRGPAFGYTDQVNNEIQGLSPPNTTARVQHFTDAALGAFGIGPSYGQFYPDTKFPQDVDFYKQAMANWGTAMGPAGPVGDARTTNATNNALIKLLEKIGPAIVMGHSSGGIEMMTAAMQRPDLFVKLVGVENVGCSTSFAPKLVKLPLLMFWGTYPAGSKADFPLASGAFGNPAGSLVVACTAMGAAIRALGGRAGMLLLEDIGLVGTTHLLMYDRVNIDIAKVVLKWIEGEGDAGLPLR